MPEIKSIKATTNDVSLFLLETVQQIESGEYSPDNIIFAMKDKDGCWINGYLNMDFNDRFEAIAHIQVDATIKMMKEN